MIKKILIANRGEIALRIIRACREMDIKSVAIYSEADMRSLHVRHADEQVCVGPADSAMSYRNIPNVLSAAEITGADAIHPGYGFLSENAHFAEVCELIGITFIGPTSEHISLLGDKAKARETMVKHGIPVMPGSDGEVHNLDEARRVGKKVGYPLIVKALAGGGGRGMRVISREEDLDKAILAAQLESRVVFGSDGVYLEKFLIDPRHIEIQVLADEHGHVIHLGERECSVQRRYQKLVEECPSPAVDDSLRQEMGKIAIKAV
ncbi:MAG: biotin carboxylase N-terminal domain-containing protein, partial [Nitrospirales bacterium]